MNNSNIPKQKEGLATDTVSKVEFDSLEEARKHFEIVKQRFLDVNNWREYMQLPISSFTVVDENGNEVNRPMEENDHFKIELPVPMNKAGEGYDWVQVQKIETLKKHDYQSVTIVVKPVPNPQTSAEDDAHFFSEDASSTFIVKQEGKTVAAEVHGRNMKANTHTENLGDKLRNAAYSANANIFFL